MVVNDRALPQLDLEELERRKFGDDADGVFIRTSAKGTFKFSGLSVELKNTTIEIGDTAVALPATPLTDRNSLVVFNMSDTETLYLGNSDVTAETPGSFPNTTWGMEIPPRSFFNCDLTSSIVLYARCKTGKTAIVKITEYA